MIIKTFFENLVRKLEMTKFKTIFKLKVAKTSFLNFDTSN